MGGWNLNPVNDLGQLGSAVAGFFSGPPGDPGRIRQIAGKIEGLRNQYQGHVTALSGAVDTLTTEWTGDGATAFRTTWHSGRGGGKAPAQVMDDVAKALDQF